MAYIIFFLFFISATDSSPPLPLPPLQPLTLQSPPPPPQSQKLVPPSQQKPLSPPPMQSPPPPTQPPPPSQPSPAHLPSSSPPPKLQQQRPAEIPQERMNNILETLIGSGDFANWANLLNMADPSLLPFTSTLFVPNNDVVSSFLDTGSGSDSDPFLFLYHVVPHRFSFSDLCLFRPNTRLPTLLPTKSVLITNTSKLNFTIDGARITDPDLYSSDSVTVHGIGGLLDYHIYGGDGRVSSFPSARQNQSPPPVKAAAGGPTIVVSSKGETLRGGFAVACCAALMTLIVIVWL
ncbi:hypothetical protein QQ045_029357 [Rhodiola kirilowii]